VTAGEDTRATRAGQPEPAAAGRPEPKPRPRRLIVLRHGQTTHNAKGLWQGQFDSDLSDLGHQQAKAAARALAALRPTRVVASDLTRAALTGQDVADECGVPIEFDERWREIHVGEWAGMTAAQVREQYPEDQDRLLRGEDFRRGGHGESVADVADRVRAALADLFEALGPGECAVIATHGVTARTIAAELVGLDQNLAWLALAGLGNCHWAELVEGAHGWRIQTWNAAAPTA
jgi:broad specificity phosphatase PhoE